MNYLNTKPLLYGIEHSNTLQSQMTLIQDYPARIARLLLSGEIDLGLAPVAILPRMRYSHIITDYCIGANGPVASVCLFSQQPLEEIQTVLLDYQSRTSVNLCRILFRHYWKKDIEFHDTRTDFAHKIKDNRAGLLIGDRAIAFSGQALYKYDLAEAWKAMTGLPFVFAVWASNKKLPEQFISLFNRRNKAGLDALDKVIEEQGLTDFDLHYYYTQNISFDLDNKKRKGLNLFLQLMKEFE